MSKKALPDGFELDPIIDARTIFSEEYEHWTVADVIGYLAEYPQDARVWLTPAGWDDDGPVLVSPLEMIYCTEGEVFL